jgi:hypothetical protein
MSKELNDDGPSILRTQGFDAFHCAYHELIWGFIRRRVRGDAQVVSDLAQDTFTAAFKRDSARAWFYAAFERAYALGASQLVDPAAYQLAPGSSRPEIRRATERQSPRAMRVDRFVAVECGIRLAEPCGNVGGVDDSGQAFNER